MAPHVTEKSSAWLAAFALFTFLAAPASASDPFVAVMRIDEQLITGESTKDDVLRFLGKPTGAGKAQFPPGWESQEVWYYLEEKLPYVELASFREDPKVTKVPELFTVNLLVNFVKSKVAAA